MGPTKYSAIKKQEVLHLSDASFLEAEDDNSSDDPSKDETKLLQNISLDDLLKSAGDAFKFKTLHQILTTFKDNDNIVKIGDRLYSVVDITYASDPNKSSTKFSAQFPFDEYLSSGAREKFIAKMDFSPYFLPC